MLSEKTKKSFFDRLKDTAFLIKNSFTVIGKDEDIKTPIIKMSILSIIIRTFFFITIFSFLLGKLISIGIILLLINIFILIPFKFFYYTRQKANLSWIVYNTITGKDISYADAQHYTKDQKGKLRVIALIDILVQYSGSQRSEKKGITSFIINLFLSSLVEVWDLLSHFMIPAIVIEKKSIKEITPELKALKNNVPATLTGVFGIDFAGDVISTLLGPVYLLLLAISVGIGYLVALVTKTAVITIGGFSFSLIPVLIIMYIIVIIGGVLKKIVEAIKVIYFTIFYTSLTRPAEIIPSIRNEITNYLLIGKNQNSSLSDKKKRI